MHARNRIMCVFAVCLLAYCNVWSGTLTAEKVIADEVLAKEIGMRPPPDGILFYPFDEDEGAVVTDYSGSGNDGAAAGCVWTDAGHRSAGAMSFDGVSDYINAGSVSNFPALVQYSVSLWFLHDGGGDMSPGYGHKLLDKTTWYHDWKLYLWPYEGEGVGHVGRGIYEGGASTGLGDGSRNY